MVHQFSGAVPIARMGGAGRGAESSCPDAVAFRARPVLGLARIQTVLIGTLACPLFPYGRTKYLLVEISGRQLVASRTSRNLVRLGTPSDLANPRLGKEERHSNRRLL